MTNAAEVESRGPVLRAGRYVFELGGASLTVDPALGGRVTALSFEGTELLTGPEVEPDNFGSTFWPSPQSVWFWPPPPEIDRLPYRATLSGATLSLESDTNAALGLAVTKRFTPDAARGCVVVEYLLHNRGSQETGVAPWEISRVFPRGLTFYPTGEDAPRTNDLVLPVFTQAEGATWLAYDPATVTAHQKLFADGSGGFLAHAVDGLLLVKGFDDMPASAAAPGESEIEIYFDGQRRYIEVEQQGPYRVLAPGQTSSWAVRWYVRRLPPGMRVEPGSAELMAFASEVAAT